MASNSSIASPIVIVVCYATKYSPAESDLFVYSFRADRIIQASKNPYSTANFKKLNSLSPRIVVAGNTPTNSSW